MKKGILIGTIGLLGSGVLAAWLETASLAQELAPFSEATRMILAQYEVLKTQSLALIETVKSLRQDRQKLLAEVEALRKENQDLAPKVKELSAALEQARQSLEILRKVHVAALARVEELEQVQIRALTQEMQDLHRSVESIKEEDLKKSE